MSSRNTFSATNWIPVTASDTVPLKETPVALFVGVAGTVTAVSESGSSALFTAVAGQVLSIQPRFVMATGTAATGIVALYN